MCYLYHTSNGSAILTYMCQVIPGPRSFPPIHRGRPFASLIRIRAMPVIGGQPLPPELLTQPALSSFALVRSPVFKPPVGSVVAFLCWPRRSRVSTGWGSPRIIISPLISLNGQRLGRVGGICPDHGPVCSSGLTPPHLARGAGGAVVISLATEVALSRPGRPSRPRSPQGSGWGRYAPRARFPAFQR